MAVTVSQVISEYTVVPYSMWQPNCTSGPSPSILRRMDLFEDPSERGKVGPDDQQYEDNGVFNCRAYTISNRFLRVKFNGFR